MRLCSPPPDHQPFYWHSSAALAALLIHGFPGTPGGDACHRPGPTRGRVERSRGLLLPGFGSDFATLGQRRHAESIHAIATALAGLHQSHTTVVLVGNSMGGALALRTTLRHPVWTASCSLPPSGTSTPGWTRPLRVAARLLPSVRPFAGANFKNRASAPECAACA